MSISEVEMDLLFKYIDKSNDEVKRTFAAGFAVTDGKIEELHKTIRDHNGRLGDVEDEQKQQKKVTDVLRWVGKHWYVAAGLLILIILVLIPMVELLGIKGLLSLIK